MGVLFSRDPFQTHAMKAVALLLVLVACVSEAEGFGRGGIEIVAKKIVGTVERGIFTSGSFTASAFGKERFDNTNEAEGYYLTKKGSFARFYKGDQFEEGQSTKLTAKRVSCISKFDTDSRGPIYLVALTKSKKVNAFTKKVLDMQDWSAFVVAPKTRGGRDDDFWAPTGNQFGVADGALLLTDKASFPSIPTAVEACKQLELDAFGIGVTFDDKKFFV